MKDIMLADTPVEQRAQNARRLFAGGKTYEAGRKAENNSNGSALDWHR